jgi:hypothetical protein
MPDTRLSDIAGLRMVERIRELEQIIAACLIREPGRAVQLCRAADLRPSDFLFDPFNVIAAAAFRVVDHPTFSRDASRWTYDFSCRVRDRRQQTERLQMFWLAMEGPHHTHRLATAIGQLADVARRLALARKHRDAMNNAMRAAWRSAMEPNPVPSKGQPSQARSSTAAA